MAHSVLCAAGRSMFCFFFFSWKCQGALPFWAIVHNNKVSPSNLKWWRGCFEVHAEKKFPVCKIALNKKKHSSTIIVENIKSDCKCFPSFRQRIWYSFLTKTYCEGDCGIMFAAECIVSSQMPYYVTSWPCPLLCENIMRVVWSQEAASCFLIALLPTLLKSPIAVVRRTSWLLSSTSQLHKNCKYIMDLPFHFIFDSLFNRLRLDKYFGGWVLFLLWKICVSGRF